MAIRSDIRIISRVVPRERDGKYVPRSVTIIQGGSGGGDVTNADHANSAYTLDEDTPVFNWFISALNDDEAQGVINFLKGIKISGHDLKRIVGTKTEYDDIRDDDMLTGLFVIDHFLRKDKPDTAKEFITFLKGWYGGNFTQGSTGAGLWQDEQGAWHLELDYAHFRRKLTAEEIEVQKTTHIGGKLMQTAAGMSCIKVEEYNDFWRCYMRTKDADGRIIYNQFKEKDQALVETFNLEKQADGKLGNHYLWRLVVSVGTDYIDLSKSVCALESDAPLVGDDIVQLGYQGTDDPNRQNAQILAGAGTGSPYIRQYVGINNFILPEEYTRIKPGDNLLTGRMNLQPGSTGSANLTDLPDEVYKAVNIGSVNLLRNTGFTGDYETEDLSAATELSADTELFSKQLEYWTGVATVSVDSEAISGYSAAIGSLSQSVSLIKGESYVISYKAKGTSVSVSCGSFSVSQPLTSSYQRYTHKITFNGSGIFLISGTATVCDLQLERGTIATDWKPSILDNDKSMAEFQAINYIASAIKDGSVDILGGLILANMVQLGNYKDGKMQKVTAGVSGIYNDDDDVAFWAGGKLEQAIRTVMRFRNDPNYQPTDEEWENMANFVVAHGGDVFLRGYIYALGGKFRGEVNAESGVFKNVKSPNGNFKIDEEGNIWIKGEGEFSGTVNVISSNGYKIVISPEDEYSVPSIRMYDYNGEELFSISLQYGLGGMIPSISMFDPSSSDRLYFRPDSMVAEQKGSDGYIYQTQIMGGRIIMVKGSEIVWDQNQLPK
nr:MAG TPA: tail protein [Caudoviricetes sp.]